MLQRFLGNLNYIARFYKDLTKYFAILYDRLRKRKRKKKPPTWAPVHTQTIKTVKLKAKKLPWLNIPSTTLQNNTYRYIRHRIWWNIETNNQQK